MNKISPIKERILQYIEYLGITKQLFCEKTGISYANIKGKSLESEFGGTQIAEILSVFGEISSDWLLTGTGNMLRNDITAKNMVPTNGNDGIPLIPISAMAGYGTGGAQVLEHECERFVIPVFKEAEFLISVKGSSMYPKYNSGDIVACKKLPLDTFFQWNKVYVLDTEQGALVKRIKKGETEDTLTIVSDNPKYDPFPLHKSKIYAIAIVLGVIRQES
ncbi:MAG: hypothetical protein FWC34_10925 [Bacteroidetes bacterium]|nr:hypothetical protein [Bacteroidota bacterium]MCL2302945.1 hypothetical protein [Lentimicrobiaceae bacterium]